MSGVPRMIFTYRSHKLRSGRNRHRWPSATQMPNAKLPTRLQTDSHTVMRKPSQMRVRYCTTKSNDSVMPAAASDAAATATTAAHTSR